MRNDDPHDAWLERLREAMVPLDLDRELDEFAVDMELQRRRSLANAAGDTDEQTSGLLLLLHYVRSVRAGFVPEPEVIGRVGAALERVLFECSHHLDEHLHEQLHGELHERLGLPDVPPGAFVRFRPPEGFPGVLPYRRDRPGFGNPETGDAFVDAFEVRRRSKLPDYALAADLARTRKRLDALATADPPVVGDTAFRKIVLEDYRRELAAVVDAERKRLAPEHQLRIDDAWDRAEARIARGDVSADYDGGTFPAEVRDALDALEREAEACALVKHPSPDVAKVARAMGKAHRSRERRAAAAKGSTGDDA